MSKKEASYIKALHNYKSPVQPPWDCDRCHKPIKTVADGWVQWTPNKASIVHIGADRQPMCCYSQHLPDLSDVPLGWCLRTTSLWGVGLDSLLSNIADGGMPLKEGLEIVKRLYLPGYEKGRTDTRTY